MNLARRLFKGPETADADPEEKAMTRFAETYTGNVELAKTNIYEKGAWVDGHVELSISGDIEGQTHISSNRRVISLPYGVVLPNFLRQGIFFPTEIKEVYSRRPLPSLIIRSGITRAVTYYDKATRSNHIHRQYPLTNPKFHMECFVHRSPRVVFENDNVLLVQMHPVMKQFLTSHPSAGIIIDPPPNQHGYRLDGGREQWFALQQLVDLERKRINMAQSMEMTIEKFDGSPFTVEEEAQLFLRVSILGHFV